MSSEYSLWFLPLCLLLGIAYAAIVYWRINKPEFPRWAKTTMGICRCIAVSLIAFLLLNPMINSVRKETEKPIIAIGIDNSQSILLTKKADYYQGVFQNDLANFLAQLSKKYTVETYLLGDSLKNGNVPTFSDEKTNTSAFFERTKSAYYHKNLGAMILLSDGIYNDGISPLYAEKPTAPIYVMAMGDTAVNKDLKIAKVNFNKTVFINNVFPIKVLVQADQLSGNKTKMEVFQNKEKVYEKDIELTSNSFSQWINLSFEAKKAGLLHYKIILSEVVGELTISNNTMDIVIEVLDSRKKVALIYKAPHPDVATLKNALQTSEAYIVESFDVEKFSKNASEYDILVLHGLPSVDFPIKNILYQIEKSAIPCFYILGKQNNYTLFNRLNVGVQIQANNRQENEATAKINSNFSNFSLSTLTEDAFQAFPPIKVPFGQYTLSPSASVLFYQKIGTIETSYPLLYYHQGQESRQVVCLGDGLWQWRLHDFLLSGNHEQFDELILKSFQYLGIKADKSFFRINTKSIYTENESITFEAELYNKNYELTTNAEVVLDFFDGKNKHHFVFSKEGKSYALNVGTFPVGDYQWTASTNYDGEKYTRSGYISIQPINLESINLTANEQLLINLASQMGGKIFRDNEFDQLLKTIDSNENIVAVAHYKEKHFSLTDTIFLLIISLGLLTIEWFLRKYFGGF